MKKLIRRRYTLRFPDHKTKAFPQHRNTQGHPFDEGFGHQHQEFLQGLFEPGD